MVSLKIFVCEGNYLHNVLCYVSPFCFLHISSTTSHTCTTSLFFQVKFESSDSILKVVTLARQSFDSHIKWTRTWKIKNIKTAKNIYQTPRAKRGWVNINTGLDSYSELTKTSQNISRFLTDNRSRSPLLLHLVTLRVLVLVLAHQDQAPLLQHRLLLRQGLL